MPLESLPLTKCSMAVSDSTALAARNATSIFSDNKYFVQSFVILYSYLAAQSALFWHSILRILHLWANNPFFHQFGNWISAVLTDIQSIDYNYILVSTKSSILQLSATVYSVSASLVSYLEQAFHLIVTIASDIAKFTSTYIFPYFTLFTSHLLQLMSTLFGFHKHILPLSKSFFHFTLYLTALLLSTLNTLLYAVLIFTLRLGYACLLLAFKSIASVTSALFNVLSYFSNMSMMVLYIKPLSYIAMLALGVGAGFGILAGGLVLVIRMLLPSKPADIHSRKIVFDPNIKVNIKELEDLEEATFKARQDILTRLENQKATVQKAVSLLDLANTVQQGEIDFSAIDKPGYKNGTGLQKEGNGTRLQREGNEKPQGFNYLTKQVPNTNVSNDKLKEEIQDEVNIDDRLSSQSSNDSLSPFPSTSSRSDDDTTLSKGGMVREGLYKNAELETFVQRPQGCLTDKALLLDTTDSETGPIASSTTKQTKKQDLSSEPEPFETRGGGYLYEDEDGYYYAMAKQDSFCSTYSGNSAESITSFNSLDSLNSTSSTETSAVTSPIHTLGTAGRHHISLMKRPPNSRKSSETVLPATQRARLNKPVTECMDVCSVAGSVTGCKVEQEKPDESGFERIPIQKDKRKFNKFCPIQEEKVE